MKNFPVFFRTELRSSLSNQQQRGEDVSQTIEPEGFVEKSDIKTDIQVGKDHLVVQCQKRSNLYKVSSVFNVCLSFAKQVNYKES